MVTPINNTAAIVQPFSEVQSGTNEQSTLLNRDKYKELLDTMHDELANRGNSFDINDKESFQKTDYKELASKLQSIIGDDSVGIEFKIDKDTNKMILKLIDKKTSEVIQQYPPEISLKIARFVAMSMAQVQNGQSADAKV